MYKSPSSPGIAPGTSETQAVHLYFKLTTSHKQLVLNNMFIESYTLI